MGKIEILKESAKTIPLLSEATLTALKSLEEGSVIDFADMEQYEQFQILVKEGYVSKDYRKYSRTEKGDQLIESCELYKNDRKKFDSLIKEDDASKEYVSIEYKKHDFENDIICTESAKFELEGGIPVVRVDEEVYANLIHRTKGQHWKQYLGEDGRQLIRQKKLQRFYVESEKTGRRYLYMV
jgi:hypothetical protein